MSTPFRGAAVLPAIAMAVLALGPGCSESTGEAEQLGDAGFQTVDGKEGGRLFFDITVRDPDSGTPSGPVACTHNADCVAVLGDKGPCRIPQCMNEVCALAAADDDSACDDGDPCTEGDACGQGDCVPGEPKVCDDGHPCTADSCDPETGACLFEAAPADGRDCSDGLPCTIEDTCSGGSCAGRLRNCDDENNCTVDTCDEGIGDCVHDATVLQGLGCDDGDACTANDACVEDRCEGQKKDCDDSNACTADGCDPETGVCVHEKDPMTGAPCEDGNPCTIEDRCADGACVSGKLKNCDDNRPCTADRCNEESGECEHSGDEVDGEQCTDTNICTLDDVCAGGFCVGTPKDCEDDDPCTTDSCNPETGDCSHDTSNVPPDTACDDQNTCTTNDRCIAGSCQGTYDGAVAGCAEGDYCGWPVEAVTVPFNFAGTTAGLGDDVSAVGCPVEGEALGQGSPDALVRFTAPQNGRYNFELAVAGAQEDGFDSVLSVFDDCPGPGSSATCLASEDVAGKGGETLSAILPAGQTAYVVVDGSGADQSVSGSYELDIVLVEPVEFDCDDQKDNDSDGQTDCGDTADCGRDIHCVTDGDVCSKPTVIEPRLPATVLGDTTAFHRDHTAAGCPGDDDSFGDGPDVVHAFTAPKSGLYSFRFERSLTRFDSVIYVVSACPPGPNTCIAASDVEDQGADEVSAVIGAGRTVFVIVDGSGVEDMGAYRVKLDLVELREVNCGDGIDDDGDNLADCDDPECLGKPECPVPGGNCQQALVVDAIPYSHTGNSQGKLDAFHVPADTCPLASDPNALAPASGVGIADVLFTFTPEDTGSFTFTLRSVDSETALTLILTADECPLQPEGPGCVGVTHVEAEGEGSITSALTGGARYFAAVDGPPDGVTAGGLFVLDVEAIGETDCGDGFDEDHDGLTDCDDADCDEIPRCMPEQVCAGGFDEDEDGKTDCSDEDCAEDEACVLRNAGTGDLVITEIMGNPADDPSSVGVWFELVNAAVGPRTVKGMTIAIQAVDPADQGSASFDLKRTLEDEIAIPSRGAIIVAAATGDALGFAPHVVFPGLSVTRDPAHQARIVLVMADSGWDGESEPGALMLVDQVTATAGAFAPGGEGEGRSWQLSVSAQEDIDATRNDEAANWCHSPAEEALALPGGGYGSPAAPNGECPN
jgi:hypothetical protein